MIASKTLLTTGSVLITACAWSICGGAVAAGILGVGFLIFGLFVWAEGG